MYDPILFPTDGSDGAAAALDHAVDLASRHGATLDVLYVSGGAEDAGDPEAIVSAAADRAGEAGVETNTSVLEGDPHERILGYVEDRGIDAVVMATHGRRGLERYLLGSVTEKLLRTADVPLLVVPYRE